MNGRDEFRPFKALREHALIISAVSSNRIEGVVVDQSRIATIVFGQPLLGDRDEEEVRGYRQALTWIHDQGAKIPVSEETILQLHRWIFKDQVECLGRGQKARWQKTADWQLGNVE